MPARSASLSTLRQLLSDRFPQAARPTAAHLPTGLAAIDDIAGGLPRHALGELICAGPSVGGHLVVGQLLAATRGRATRVALIDAADQFDPRSHPAEDLQHLVWVRCPTPAEALPVADLLARESNLDLVILDLVHAPQTVLRRIPATTWYRLQRATAQTDLAFLVLTPAALVPSAQLRFRLDQTHALRSQDLHRPHLLINLEVIAQRQRAQAHGASE